MAMETAWPETSQAWFLPFADTLLTRVSWLYWPLVVNPVLFALPGSVTWKVSEFLKQVKRQSGSLCGPLSPGQAGTPWVRWVQCCSTVRAAEGLGSEGGVHHPHGSYRQVQSCLILQTDSNLPLERPFPFGSPYSPSIGVLVKSAWGSQSHSQ